jgi:hypothetical protein
MKKHPSGSAALFVLIVLAGLVLAASNVLVVLTLAAGGTGPADVAALLQGCPRCVIYLGAMPVVFALAMAFLVARRPTAPAPAAQPAAVPVPAPPPAPPSPAPALRLLAVLQQEGRLIDFLQENLDDYSDAQVGAAVRSIHAGCRKALSERVTLERVLPDEDGSSVVVAAGFDPAAIRLIGNVTGNAPFRGTLAHGGWRVVKVSLPESPGNVDASIVAPAEVEIS